MLRAEKKMTASETEAALPSVGRCGHDIAFHAFLARKGIEAALHAHGEDTLMPLSTVDSVMQQIENVLEACAIFERGDRGLSHEGRAMKSDCEHLREVAMAHSRARVSAQLTAPAELGSFESPAPAEDENGRSFRAELESFVTRYRDIGIGSIIV